MERPVADAWYYAKDGQPMGPVSAAVLREMALGGALLPETLVWREGMSNWAPLCAARGLFPPSSPPQVHSRIHIPDRATLDGPAAEQQSELDEALAQALAPVPVQRGLS